MLFHQRTLRIAILAVAGTAATIAALRVVDLGSRLQRVERTPRADPAVVASMRLDLVQAEARLEEAQREIERLRASGERTVRMERRIDSLTADLARASSTIVEQRQRLECFEADAPRVLDERLETYRQDSEEQWRKLDETARSALDLARSARHGVDEVEQGLERDEDRMWRELVGPTVQIIGDETVGSGVVLKSQPSGKPGEFQTYLLTAWHVVRDLQKGAEDLHFAVPVTVYGQDRRVWPESAHVERFDMALDVALLKLDTTRLLECGAKLAPRSRLEKVRIFERVYAVGCPLGNDPIPTFGEVADTHHVVDGSAYWMISAPTYIGNSGGGIYDAQTHELLGIFSKIYTHGAVRPTVVPHMGLATSMQTIYDWLDHVGFANLEAADAPVDAQVASAKK
jgi:S1-C subfamily serine protease